MGAAKLDRSQPSCRRQQQPPSSSGQSTSSRDMFSDENVALGRMCRPVCEAYCANLNVAANIPILQKTNVAQTIYEPPSEKKNSE